MQRRNARLLSTATVATLGAGRTYWFGWESMTKTGNAQSSTAGSFALYVNGQLVVDKHDVRTWDLKGNVPRWGTYGSTISDVESVNWVDGLKMGSSRADVDQ